MLSEVCEGEVKRRGRAPGEGVWRLFEPIEWVERCAGDVAIVGNDEHGRPGTWAGDADGGSLEDNSTGIYSHGQSLTRSEQYSESLKTYLSHEDCSFKFQRVKT